MRIATLLLFLAFSTSAHANVYKFGEPIIAKKANGEEILLAAGYYFENRDFLKLDAEVVRLQEAEIRLRAENEYLRTEVSKGPWKSIFISVGVGFLVGAGTVLAVR